MIKQFTYNVSAYIQNRINGEQTIISQQYVGEIEVANTMFISEFIINDDQPLLYVNDALNTYIENNNIVMADLDIIKIAVSSDDPDVIVYFETHDSDEIYINNAILAYLGAEYDEVPVPILTGTVIDQYSVKWEWTLVDGCSYVLVDTELNPIANIGIGTIEFTEINLESDTNYTRAIMAYDGTSYSEVSEFITLHTEQEEYIPENELPLFSDTIDEDIDLTLIEESNTDNFIIKSGIGHGSDCKVDIYDNSKEDFKSIVKIDVYDTILEDKYIENYFQYRQKTTSNIDRVCKFGQFSGDIYAHPRDQYNFSINAKVYAPLWETIDTTLNLEAMALGFVSKEEEYKYRINGSILNKPVNLTRNFNYILNVEYDTSYSFNYRVKHIADTGEVTYSDWYLYNNLKSYIDYISINNTLAIDLIDGSFPVEELSIETDSSVIDAKIELGYIVARNNIPDNYNSSYILENSIQTIQDELGKIILDSDELIQYKPKYNDIEYNGTNYEDFIYTFSNVSNVEVSLDWVTSITETTTGVDILMATTSAFNTEFKNDEIFFGNILTPLYDAQNTHTFERPYIQLLADEYPTGDNQEVVLENDRYYTGDYSEGNYTFTLLSGDVIADMVNNQITIVVLQLIGEYKSRYSIDISIPTGTSGIINLFDAVEVGNYKPYAGAIEWPFDINNIVYTITNNHRELYITFENDSLESLGPQAIKALVSPLNVLYSAVKEYIGYIYDYEYLDSPKIVGNKEDIILLNSGGHEFNGNNEDIVYTIINNSPRQHIIINDNNITIEMVIPKEKRLVQHLNDWYNNNPITLDYSNYIENAHYSIEKTGGHNNTLAIWTDNPSSICKDIGDIIYSSNGKIMIYALEEEITLNDIEYSPWENGIINENNILSSLVVPLLNLANESAYNIVNEIEFKSDIEMYYTINLDEITIYNDDIITEEIITSKIDELIGESNILTLYNNSILQDILITVSNPYILYPNKKYILNCYSNNPNITISTDFLFDETNTNTTIEIGTNAEIFIQGQSKWHPKITPGYYYTNIKEHYLFGSIDNQVVTNLGNGIYNVAPVPKQGVIILTDENGLPMTEVFGDLDIDEVGRVINKKYIKVIHNNIDIDSILINGLPLEEITIINNIIILPNDTDDDIINIRYRVNNSYFVKYFDSYLQVETHSASSICNVFCETSDAYVDNNINLNPLRNASNLGFLYIKE